MTVTNQIKCEYISHMGSDDSVVNYARVSFDKTAESYTEEQNNKLIHYLAKHNHISPFTHPQITVRETMPVFCARQRMKSVVGFSYNEVSRRYVSSEPTFYTPSEWRGKADNVKQGSSDKVIDLNKHPWTKGSVSELGSLEEFMEQINHDVLIIYDRLIEVGVCPEQARMILPQSMMTEVIVTGSLAAFARAYKLRIDSHAQKEIQDLAIEWDKLIRPLFSVSWEALVGE